MSALLKTNRIWLRHSIQTLLVLITTTLVFDVSLMCGLKPSGAFSVALGLAGILCVGLLGYIGVTARRHWPCSTDTTARNAPWYHLTAERLVLGLLAVEGFLLLSDYYCWFPFNQHKDRTVLIAVTAAGATLVLFLLRFAMSLAFRWRFQFALRSLLLLIMAVALAASWLTAEMRRERSQGLAASALVKAGGKSSAGLTLLGRLLGDDSLVEVTDVVLKGAPITDADLIHVRHFARLRVLVLSGTQITDTGLAHLRGLSSLVLLDLRKTKVTDAGLENLKGMKRLDGLWLSGTRVSEAGLVHLGGLTELSLLVVDGTGVTAHGVNKLRQALPACEIWWDDGA